ncbi:MAG: cytochrome c oxidase subunit 3 [Myxococcales bacterium]|nr:cytochrome c oxidase subunit 3 [Myxococcales bacterium]MCB9643090.1 cytochrome c oxidase subunit 3 [Myxococcales bacterium]
MEQEKHPFDPPGGMMIWLFIWMELLVFGAAFLTFAYIRKSEYSVFVEAQKHLNQSLGLGNTILLLTSGFAIAVANKRYEDHNKRQTLQFLWGGIGLGTAFLVLKSVEYSQKITKGLTTGTNAFFDFYWLLTAFHAAHVLVGLVLLVYMAHKIRRDKPFSSEDLSFKGSSAWWHMCDLVWVLLFPLLYLW